MAPLTFTSLVPARGAVQAGPMLASLALPRREDRPYTLVNFIASADGRAAFEGRSRAFSDPGDRELFHSLRERADAVLAGTATLALERYGRLIPSAERRARRVAAGRPAEPVAVMISRRGDLPLGIPLFAEPEARVIAFVPGGDLNPEGVRASVRVEPLEVGSERGSGSEAGSEPGSEPGLARAMAALRQAHGIETLLCEGGPILFAALLRARLVDELFLTLAPALAGGDSGPAVTGGPPLPAPERLELLGLLQRESCLYLRYAVRS